MLVESKQKISNFFSREIKSRIERAADTGVEWKENQTNLNIYDEFIQIGNN